MSRGKEAFNFQFFKFGKPDESLARPQDATLKIRMSSVIYVHTQRFYSELFAFFNTFQDLMSKENGRPPPNSPTKVGPRGTPKKKPAVRILPAEASPQQSQRGSRILVDLEAGSPLLILPMSSFASQVLATHSTYFVLLAFCKISCDLPGGQIYDP